MLVCANNSVIIATIAANTNAITVKIIVLQQQHKLHQGDGNSHCYGNHLLSELRQSPSTCLLRWSMRRTSTATTATTATITK
jgi:hypothetical protein